MDILIKRMDHMERARRENEAPLLQEAYAQKIKVSNSSLCSACTMAVSCLSAVATLSVRSFSGKSFWSCQHGLAWLSKHMSSDCALDYGV